MFCFLVLLLDEEPEPFVAPQTPPKRVSSASMKRLSQSTSHLAPRNKPRQSLPASQRLASSNMDLTGGAGKK